jgi:hypothetical protein
MIVEQCGFCGRYFRGLEYLTEEELRDYFSCDDYEKPKLGYCPNAIREAEEQDFG